MKLIYTHPNRLIVENIKNVLENAGLKVQLQNQYAGGGVGELAPIDAWPEVWVVDDRDRERAVRAIEELRNAPQGPDWTCTRCGSDNPAAFETCWHCAGERPGQ